MWNDVQKQVPVTNQLLVQPQKVQSEKTRVVIQQYTDDITDKKKQFMKKDFWQFATGTEVARESMKKSRSELEAEKKICEANALKCRLLDFPDLIKESTKEIEAMFADITNMEALWDVVQASAEFFRFQENQLWSEVNAES